MVQKILVSSLEKTREEAEVVLEETADEQLQTMTAVAENILEQQERDEC